MFFSFNVPFKLSEFPFLLQARNVFWLQAIIIVFEQKTLDLKKVILMRVKLTILTTLYCTLVFFSKTWDMILHHF